jgi:hypothetical protein
MTCILNQLPPEVLSLVLLSLSAENVYNLILASESSNVTTWLVKIALQDRKVLNAITVDVWCKYIQLHITAKFGH